MIDELIGNLIDAVQIDVEGPVSRPSARQMNARAALRAELANLTRQVETLTARCEEMEKALKKLANEDFYDPEVVKLECLFGMTPWDFARRALERSTGESEDTHADNS